MTQYEHDRAVIEEVERRLPLFESGAKSLADRDAAVSLGRKLTRLRFDLVLVLPPRTRPLALGEQPRPVSGELLMRKHSCERRIDAVWRRVFPIVFERPLEA